MSVFYRYMENHSPIIDAHTHFPAGARPGAGAALLAAARRAGVAGCVVSCLGDFAAHPDDAAIRRCNAFAAGEAAAEPGRLKFLGYLNPQNQNTFEEIDRCVRDGAAGLKLWISLRDERGSLERTQAVLREAARRNLPVLIHTFDRAGGTNMPGEITFAEFVALARAVPECTLIGAHATSNFRKNTAWFDELPRNAYCDVSGVFPENGALAELLRHVPAERILYGSDAPGRSFASQLAKFDGLGIAERERSAMLGGSAAKLFGMTPEPVPTPEHPEPGEECDHELYCGRWPYDPAWTHSPAELENLLAGQRIRAGYAASFDVIFAPGSLSAANLEYARSYEPLSRVRPLAAVDPTRPDARETLAAVLHDRRFAGVWMSPYFHRWSPEDACFAPCAGQIADAGKPLYLNFGFADARFRPEKLAVRGFSDAAITAMAARFPPGTVLQGCRIAPSELPAGVRISCVRLTDSESFLAELAGTLPASEFPARTLACARLIFHQYAKDSNL